MANSAQTSAATAAEQETIKAIEQKLSGLSSIMEGFKTSVEDFSKAMTDEKSQFFQNMSNIMFGSMQRNDADKRAYEEAKAQNEEARKMAMGARGPERGQAGFWEAAFASTPEKPEEVQARAISKAFTSSDVKKQLQEAFSTATIKQAVREGDSRTTGEKALDFMGFGFVNKLKHKFQDRDIIREEKATKKDQDSIARDMKEKSRLEAKIRKARSSVGNEEEVENLMAKLRGVSENIKAAEARIDERKKPIDPYADLVEKEGSIMDAVKSPLLPESVGRASTVVANKDDYYAKLGNSMNNPSGSRFTKTGDGAADKDSAGMSTGRLLGGMEPETLNHANAVPGDVDEKEAADIERRLDTQLRPEFYQEGTKFFKKANGGKLFEGLDIGGGGGLLGGKGGLYAAGGAAVAAALGTIAFAGKKFKDLMEARSEANSNIDSMTENAKKANEERKKGWNNDMRDATQESIEANNELAKESNDLTSGISESFEQSWLGRKLGWTSEKTKLTRKASLAESKRQLEMAKTRKFRKAAEESGIDVNDADAMNRFKEEYDRSGGKVATAGNTSQTSTPTAGTPGGQVNTDKVESAEERDARNEEAMYRAVKRAQLDDDVQKQNLENAKVTGQQIDQSLVGRK